MKLPPFQAVLDAHHRDLYRFLVATVGLPDADDCFQETFLAALRAYPRLTSAENLRGWLMTIARRKSIDVFRARRRNGALPPDEQMPAGETGRDDGDVWVAVRRLPPKQSTAIAYRYAGDMAYREIARLTGGTEEAARQNVRAGLRTLREVYIND